MRDLSAMRSRPLIAASSVLEPLPPATRYILRGGQAVTAAAERAFGVGMPANACRALTAGDRAALWLGPDEWLLLAHATDAAGIAAALAAALADLPHSLVDVSHRQSALAVSGPHAASVLSAGCPLDLDASAFPVGMCTRTMLAKAEVILWRTGAVVFRIEVARSFVAYVSGFVAEAARGISEESRS
jgi:sarcosine oxidase, subunit gamma